MPLLLKNPHSILAVLETRPEDIFEIHLPSAAAGPEWENLRSAARDIGVKATRVRDQRGSRARESGRSGAACAAVKPRRPLSLEQLFDPASDRPADHGCWLALDTVQDPQNLGSIFRSAAFFGVRGLVLSRDRSASLTSTVYDIASGGVEHVPFTVETNLSRTLSCAKGRGLWVLGTSERAETSLSQVAADRPWLVVLGNESTGMRRLTREKCDVVCRIPSHGRVGSLNVSVSAGILLHSLRAQAPPPG